MTQGKKLWIGLGAVLLVLGLLGVGFAKRRNSDTATVETEVLRRRELVSIVTASGEIQPENSVDVHANVNGTIDTVAVREGQFVQEGDLLLRIDPVSMEAASEAQAAHVRAAERQVEAQRVQLGQLRRDLQRARSLSARELISTEELQRAEVAVARGAAELAALEAHVEQARANLRSSEHELSKVTVTAPRAGVVTRLDVEQGEFAFSTGLSPTLLLTIADLSTMQAEIKVDETDVVKMKLGQQAKVSVDAFPDTTFRGDVTEVGTSPIIEEKETPAEDAKDFKVVVTLAERLPEPRAGLSATADIETARRRDAVALPIQSLVVRELPRLTLGEAPADTLDREETEGVFVVRGGRAHFVPVHVGVTADRYFEVSGGVQPGDTVVSGSYEVLRDLEDGDRVRPAKPRKRGPGDRRRQEDRRDAEDDE